MALNDYDYIKTKIRKITGRPSPNQLSDDDLKDYIHSFVVYDFPLITRLYYDMQNVKVQLTPRVGNYSIDTVKNLYSNVEPPAYIDNIQINYMQDLTSFERVFARYKYSTLFGTSTGIAGPYAYTFSYTPIQAETCIISTVAASGANLLAKDDGVGGFVDEAGNVIAGATINYLTGVIAGITFSAVPPLGSSIYISARQYVVGRPFAVLYQNNEFRFWPFPDRAYTFQICAYPNFAAFTAGTEFPELKQWADTIAFGTSLKIFQDNLDMESYQKTFPFFDNAKRLAGRRTLQQLSTQQVATIYNVDLWGGNKFYNYPYGG